MKPRVGVLGGGAFGRAIAATAARGGCDVVLASRVLEAVEGVRIVRDASGLSDADLIFVCVPSHAVEASADELAASLDGRHCLVHVSRGLVGDDLVPLTAVLRDRTPCRRVGVLAGPLVPTGLVAGRPGSAIVGTRFPEVASLVREAIASDALRVYDTDDVVGVEFASACVGALTVAVGFASALDLGPGALATVVTRGVHEAARLGEAVGGQRVTFGGLAGMGDLVAVVAGDPRPEFELAKRLVAGAPTREALAAIGTHVESVTLAARLRRFAQTRDVPLPILGAVASVLSDDVDAVVAMRALMARGVGRETN